MAPQTVNEPLPPPRSLLWIKTVPAEQGGGLEIACDCGNFTHLRIEFEDGAELEAHEVPFTCDGCLSTHWFTLGKLS